MLTRDVFEELLATYPAERRELARLAYHRFADGNSTEFFTQLFLLLDVYAHYAERVPQAVLETNQNAHAGMLKIREEIGLLAATIDKRDLNITNHAEKTEELCQEAIAKCDEVLARFEAVLKEFGASIDTKAIVSNLRETLEAGIKREIISPFVNRSNELAEQVTPTLDRIREAAAEAGRVWPSRIWKIAWANSLLWSITFALLAITIACWKFKEYYAHEAAAQIREAEQIVKFNQEAFQTLAVAQVQVRVVRTQDANGATNPSGFALMIANADAAEMRVVDSRNTGMIFFTSPMREKQIRQLQQNIEIHAPANTNLTQ